MGIKAVAWIFSVIALRLFFEDWLSGRGPTRPLALAHKLAWWWSVILAYLAVVGRAVDPGLVRRFLIITIPVICLPPLIDWPERRFDYPYPNGGLLDYLRWVLCFMPHYVTSGQKLQILLILLGTLALVALRQGFLRSLLVAWMVYVVLSLYAWFPALLRFCLPWARTHHDACALAVLSFILVFQIFGRKSC
ncbi:MAG: hypothetical protein QNK37_35195 [Acidobacteriota bacterium]|nr:hypothetical protein [Acidobacteriota bacterium]